MGEGRSQSALPLRFREELQTLPWAAAKGYPLSWTGGTALNPMDQRIETFLADVLALAGEDPDAVRAGVRVALAGCEAIFRAQETHERMKDKAAHACRALCRASVAEELQRGRGARIAEHLKRVLSVLHRPRRQPGSRWPTCISRMQRGRGARIAEHLKRVLSVIDRQELPAALVRREYDPKFDRRCFFVHDAKSQYESIASPPSSSPLSLSFPSGTKPFRHQNLRGVSDGVEAVGSRPSARRRCNPRAGWNRWPPRSRGARWSQEVFQPSDGPAPPRSRRRRVRYRAIDGATNERCHFLLAPS